MGIIKEIVVSKKADPYFVSMKVELYHYDKVDEELAALKTQVDDKIHEWIVKPREGGQKSNGRKTKDYDREHQVWIACPLCGSVDIDHVSKSGKEYQGCTQCQIFLNPNGTTAPMRARG